MEEIVLKPLAKIRVRLGEEAWDITVPSNRQLAEFSKDETTDKFDLTVKFLAKLGLPEEVSLDKLGTEGVQQVISGLIPQQKKS